MNYVRKPFLFAVVGLLLAAGAALYLSSPLAMPGAEQESIQTGPLPAVSTPSGRSTEPGTEPALGIMGTPRVDPMYLVATEPTPVTVTIQLRDPGLIPDSVNLQRLDETGRVTALIGALHDDGANGDFRAGDAIYTIRTTFVEPPASSSYQLRLQVSAAFRGILRRSTSGVFTLQVGPYVDPEQTLSQFIRYLRQGDIESAVQMVSEQEEEETLRAQDEESLRTFADALSVARLLEAQRSFRVYETRWQDSSGEILDVKFFLTRNVRGEWKFSF